MHILHCITVSYLTESATIFSHISEEKPLLKVEGEWNGVMFAHHPNGVGVWLLVGIHVHNKQKWKLLLELCVYCCSNVIAIPNIVQGKPSSHLHHGQQ